MASIQRGVEAVDVALGKALPARMTEEEFVARCDEDTRAEWIDGEMVIMSPASIVHNRLSRFLLSLLEEPEWLWRSPLPKVPGILRELLAQT